MTCFKPVRRLRNTTSQLFTSPQLQEAVQESPRPANSLQKQKMLHNTNKSLPAGIYISPASAALYRTSTYSSTSLNHSSPLPATTNFPTEDLPTFIDYYAILDLDIWATTNEIKMAYRNLRAEYFNTNISKYRVLQTAFDILVNHEARREYDIMYRSYKGPVKPKALPVSLEEEMKGCAWDRDDSGVDMNSQESGDVEAQCEEEEVIEMKDDPNWSLKHFRKVYEPVTGTAPYVSFVPIAGVYDGMHSRPKLKCGRPKYIGAVAGQARPK